jgi:hypothetical protein
MLSAGRIDWKYLLGLELTDPGLDASVPSEFRGRLVAGGAEEHLLDTLLPLCRDLKLLNARGRLRTNSTHVLGAVRFLNRLECVTETLRAALNALATAAPEWLRAEADPAWLERYARRAGDHEVPLGEAKRRAHAEQIGRDGHQLLAAIMAPGAPIWLRQIPAVELLRQAWVQNFCLIDDAPPQGLRRHFGCGGELTRGVSTLLADGRLALRSGGALRQEAVNDLDRLQGASDRDVRRRRPTLDHACGDHAGTRR